MQSAVNLKRRFLDSSALLFASILMMSHAVLTFAQDSRSGDYSIDFSTERYKELLIGFQVLYGELSHRPVSSVNEEDEILIFKAVTEAPYYLESIQITIDACNEFESTGRARADTAHIMQLITESSEWDYKGQEKFQESLYSKLSSLAKTKFNSIIEEHSRTITGITSSSFDHAKFAREHNRATILDHIEQRCERVPLLLQTFGSGLIEAGEVPIDWRAAQ